MKKPNQTLCKIFILSLFLSSEGFSNDNISGRAKVIDGDTILVDNKKPIKHELTPATN